MLSERCANIGPRGQDSRLRVGVISFTVTLALAIGLAKAGAPSELRWLLAVPFFGAVLGVVQALYGTCPYMAAKGLRDKGDGAEAIFNPSELKRVRAKARFVLLASAAIAVAAAGFFAQLGA